MSKHPLEGHDRIVVQLDKLNFTRYQEWTASKPFLASVRFYFEAAIKATEDEPGCDAYLQLLEAYPTTNIYLSNEEGEFMTLKPHEDFSAALSDKGVDNIVTAIVKKSEQEQRYIDPDSRRPDVDERARRELGWGLF